MRAPTDVLFINASFLDPMGFGYTPHLGLLYIATFLKEEGFNVKYLDLQDDRINLERLIEEVRKISPSIIAISVNTDNYHSVINIVESLKRKFTDVLIILGGPEASGRDMGIFDRCSCDIVVRGEGELTTLELANFFILGKGRIQEILGITYKENNKIKRNYDRPLIKNLDDLPFPDRQLLDEPKKYMATLITGRGCPYSCSFCYESLMGNKYRIRSPENILREIEELLRIYKKTYIAIVDSTFTVYPEHVKSVCEGMIERFEVSEELVWFCEGRANVLAKHPSLIDVMVDAGMVRIQIGIESASSKILKAYEKKINLSQVVKVVKKCVDSNVLSIYGGFIIGGPFETKATISKSVAFAKKLIRLAPGRFECRFAFLTPLIKTKIKEFPDQYDLEIIDPDLLTSSNFNFCTVKTKDLEQDEINNLQNHFSKEINKEMKRNITKVPKELIDAHFDLLNRFKLVTDWYTNYTTYPLLFLYHETLRSNIIKTYKQISKEEILNRYSLRLPYPIHMKGNLIELDGGINKLTLNELGSEIYRLSSGKLKVKEVIGSIKTKLKERAPSDSILTEHVLDFYEMLDENFGILFREM
jgi:radical SAM superfamily enzyme YgiQ (UPF0313 family)